MPDVTIVGGGPAGSLSARLLATSGRSVTILEDHTSVGEPTHCAGVFTSGTIGNLGVTPTILATLRGADVVLPDGHVLTLNSKEPLAFAVDRIDLDRKLSESAIDAGAELQLGCKCIDHSITGEGVLVNTTSGEYRSDILVGADGQASAIADSIPGNTLREYLLGFQTELNYRSEEQDRLTLHVGKCVAPGFFAWQIPLGDTTRVGLAISPEYGSPSEHMNRFLRRLGLDEKTRLKNFGGKIPIGGRPKIFSDRLLLIGDAAGQIKPVSGGGLYPISKAAPILRDTVNKAFDKHCFDASVLSGYGKGCNAEFEKSFKTVRKVRKEYCKMSDESMSSLGAKFDTPEIIDILSGIDLDDPSKVVWPILSQKGMKTTFLKYILGVL